VPFPLFLPFSPLNPDIGVTKSLHVRPWHIPQPVNIIMCIYSRKPQKAMTPYQPHANVRFLGTDVVVYPEKRICLLWSLYINVFPWTRVDPLQQFSSLDLSFVLHSSHYASQQYLLIATVCSRSTILVILLYLA